MKKENNEFKVIKEDKNIFKVAMCFAVSFVFSVIAVVVGATYYFTTTEVLKIEAERENTKLNVKLDKFTYCLQSMMIESKNAGKAIDAQKAKEICQSLEK